MSTCVTYSPISYQNSKWVSAWLPIRYTLTSSKWPVNTFDDTDTISSIADDGGFARVTLSATSMTYVKLEHIKITDASQPEYNGVWRIKTVNSSTDLTITAPYTSTATGSFQRYYNNYAIKARVFVGIPDLHELQTTSGRAIEQKGEMTIRPNPSNQAIVDISSYVRADVSPIENKLCSIITDDIYGNDYNLWTAFYIAHAETYDLSDGTEISTFTSSFISDLSDDGYSSRLYYAANSALQFQYHQGKSMGEYAIYDVVDEEFTAKFMTNFSRPVYFLGNEYDTSVIVAWNDDEISGFSLQYVLTEYDSNETSLGTTTYTMTTKDAGIYRFAFSEFSFDASATSFDFYLKKSTGEVLTEVKRFTINQDACGKNPIYLRWMNPVGGFDAWLFIADHDYSFDVVGRETTRRDVYNNWDTVFSLTGDTEDDYVYTETYERRIIRSQYLETGEKQAFRWLATSTKVYHVFLADDSNCGNYRQRTVLMDDGEFMYQSDGEKLKAASFSFRYTDPVRVQGQ